MFASLEAASLIGPLIWSRPATPRWRGGILFDDRIQDALLLHGGRGTLSSATDVGLIVLQALPVLDAGVTAWWLRRQRDVGFQLAVIDLESYAFTDVVIWSLKTAIARERPQDYRIGCFAAAGSSNPDCAKAKSTSFPSNHAALSFTAASLFCTEHANLALYDGRADNWACAGMVAAATAVSVSRAMADHHYTTDILAGAAIAVASGWGLPTLLHFRHFREHQGPLPFSLGVVPVPTTTGMSLSLVGSV